MVVNSPDSGVMGVKTNTSINQTLHLKSFILSFMSTRSAIVDNIPSGNVGLYPIET